MEGATGRNLWPLRGQRRASGRRTSAMPVAELFTCLLDSAPIPWACLGRNNRGRCLAYEIGGRGPRRPPAPENLELEKSWRGIVRSIPRYVCQISRIICRPAKRVDLDWPRGPAPRPGPPFGRGASTTSKQSGLPKRLTRRTQLRGSFISGFPCN